MPENVQITKTEEDHTAITEEAEKDTTEKEMIYMTDMTGIFQLNSDATDIGITEIDMIETIEMIVMIEMIGMKEDVTIKEIAMTEIVTETTDGEIVPDLTLIPNRRLKAAIVVIERKRNFDLLLFIFLIHIFCSKMKRKAKCLTHISSIYMIF